MTINDIKRIAINTGGGDRAVNGNEASHLAMHEQWLNAFFSAAPVGLVLLDADLRYVKINDTAAKINGVPMKDHLGKAIREVLPKFAPVVEPLLRKVLATGQPLLNIELSGERPNRPGLLQHFMESFSPAFGEDGSPDGVGAIIVDITERKQAEDELREKTAFMKALVEDLSEKVAAQEITNNELTAVNKELESFSYSVSHDLRAPLRAIDGFSRIVLEDYRDKLDDAGKDSLTRIRAASQRMGQLIDDMLQLSRLTRAELRRAPVDLSTLASTVADELQKAEPTRRVEFVVEPNLTAQADTNLIHVVLQNLLGNAWKFTGKQSTSKIEFGRTTREGVPAFFVRDNGAGFDMKYASKLFGAFQRLHAATDFPGTGIGLATVQRIIHRHGGRVWAESTPGHGATFHFTLPTKAIGATL